MSILTQTSLFAWENLDRSSPIVLLEHTLDALPDDTLIEILVRERKGKRNEYPVECLWRAMMAGALLGHPTRAALIAELRRNGELRDACGFDATKAEHAVPPAWVFSRFARKLRRHLPQILAMFERMVERLGGLLPDLGQDLAVDSKALVVRGRKPVDAQVGTKRYESVDENGLVQKTEVRWFGYKLHLLVDARYEIPLAWDVTQATCADSTHLMPLVEHLKEEHPQVHSRAKTLAADKAYDDGADKAALYDDHGIVPLIPPRDLWKETRRRPLDERYSDTIYLEPTGGVVCKINPFDPDEDKVWAPMQFHGYDRARGALKFRCPMTAFGIECNNRDACRGSRRAKQSKYGRVVRIPLERDRRIYLPFHAPSTTFARAYKQRTSVERVNSRIDRVHGLEWALVDSRQAMTLRVALAFLAMTASACAWIEAERPDQMRRLLRAA